MTSSAVWSTCATVSSRSSVTSLSGTVPRVDEVSPYRVVGRQIPKVQVRLGAVVDRVLDEVEQAASAPIVLRVADEVARNEPS